MREEGQELSIFHQAAHALGQVGVPYKKEKKKGSTRTTFGTRPRKKKQVAKQLLQNCKGGINIGHRNKKSHFTPEARTKGGGVVGKQRRERSLMYGAGNPFKKGK